MQEIASMETANWVGKVTAQCTTVEEDTLYLTAPHSATSGTESDNSDVVFVDVSRAGVRDKASCVVKDEVEDLCVAGRTRRLASPAMKS